MSKGFTGLPQSTFEARIERIRAELDRRGLDALFVFSDEYRPGSTLYLADYYPINVIEESPQGVYVPASGDVVLFLGAINAVTAREISWISDIRFIDTLDDFFAREKARLGHPVRAGLAGEALLPVKYQRRLTNILADNDFVTADDIIQKMRLVKDPDEVVRMDAVGKLADASIKAAVERLNQGNATEVEVAAHGEFVIRKAGGEIGSATVLASGINTEKPTWRPNKKVIQPGEVVLLDFNPSLQGYCADTAITVVHGDASGKKGDIVRLGIETLRGAIEYAKPGEPASRIFEFFLNEMKKAGYEEEFRRFAKGTRAVGHSVGLDVVEWPDLDGDSAHVLEPGMVFAVKFDLHGFDFGGIRHEVEMLVEESSCRSLNNIIYEIM